MAEPVSTGADALVMHERDHVATALKDLKKGQTVSFRVKAQLKELTGADDIAFGHKLAIVAIEAETEVCKYGEIIGRATEQIVPGQHVHVHNIEGIRGRGDKVKSGEDQV